MATAKDAALWDAFREQWLSHPSEAAYQAALTERGDA